MKNNVIKMGAALIVLLAATAGFADTLKDSRDGKTYKTVQIGEKVWMAENLNYRTSEGKCYKNKPENCDKYGYLYLWREALTACPDGWRLPSMEELEELKSIASQSAGDKDKAGTVLKSQTGWFKNGNGTDALGFAALPAGQCVDGTDFYDETRGSRIWSSTEYDGSTARYLHLDFSRETARISSGNKNTGFSVRCIKD